MLYTCSVCCDDGLVLAVAIGADSKLYGPMKRVRGLGPTPGRAVVA